MFGVYIHGQSLYMCELQPKAEWKRLNKLLKKIICLGDSVPESGACMQTCTCTCIYLHVWLLLWENVADFVSRS